jgi:hypothetical protein
MSSRGPDPIRNDRRRARRLAKLPADAVCAVCGWRSPDALLRTGKNLLERDHTDGDANNPNLVAPACPNCHSVHSEGQRRLGVNLTHDEERSVLERHADALRSRAAFYLQLADNDQREAERLDALATAFDEKDPDWRLLPEAKP